MLKITKKEMIRRMKKAPTERFRAGKFFTDDGGGCALGLIFEPFLRYDHSYDSLPYTKSSNLHNALYGYNRERRLSSGLGYVADAFNAGMQVSPEMARKSALIAMEAHLPATIIIKDLAGKPKKIPTSTRSQNPSISLGA